MGQLIGLSGAARAGKDSLAGFIISASAHWGKGQFIKYGFADPIKEVGRTLFGWDERHANGSLKEVIDPFWGFSPRTFYQLLGTQFAREMLRDDFWIRMAEKLTQTQENIIISDVRFPNEVDFILKNGGTWIRVIRPDQQLIGATGHVSENAISEELFQKAKVVYNSGSMDHLEAEARKIIYTITPYDD